MSGMSAVDGRVNAALYFIRLPLGRVQTRPAALTLSFQLFNLNSLLRLRYLSNCLT